MIAQPAAEATSWKPAFILVDFENVQLQNLRVWSGHQVQIKIFLGPHQTRIPLAMAQAIQVLGTAAEYIPVDGSGRNALDFHVAYYMGRLAAKNPGSSFHIVSGDTGYDPLVRHLNAKGISCQRASDWAEIKLVPTSAAKLELSQIDTAIINLVARKASKPGTLTTLRSSMKALFANQLSDQALNKLIQELTNRGVIQEVGGKLQYKLPA